MNPDHLFPFTPPGPASVLATGLLSFDGGKTFVSGDLKAYPGGLLKFETGPHASCAPAGPPPFPPAAGVVQGQPEPYIVGEATANWKMGEPYDVDRAIGRQFHRLLAINLARGYALHSWRLTSALVGPGHLCETVVAVFVHVETATRLGHPVPSPLGSLPSLN